MSAVLDFSALFAPPRQFIRRVRPSVIEMRIGYDHPRDENIIEWVPSYVSRNDAARELRAARKRRLGIEITDKGYAIYGSAHPVWGYE